MLRPDFLAVFALLLLPVWMIVGEESDSANNPSDDSTTAFSSSDQDIHDTEEVLLERIILEITGKTLEIAILREMKIEEGLYFADRKTFELEISRDIQELVNLRVFSSLEYHVDYLPATGDADPGDNAARAILTITAVDTWSIFPFLVPKNEGAGSTLQLAVVDKNFLGSLTELAMSGSLSIGRDPVNGEYEISDWETYLKWSGITFRKWQFSSRISVGFMTERKLDTFAVHEDLSYYQFRWMTDIRYEVDFLRNLYLHILPVLGSRFAYDVRIPGTNPVEYEYFTGGLGLSVEYNRVDWIGFLRKGWSAGILNYFWTAYNGDRFTQKDVVTMRTHLHLITGPEKGINLNYRFLGYISFNHETPALGKFVRGVDTDIMYGDRSVVFNSGIQFRIFGWDWMDVHLQPFLDMGIAIPEGDSLSWSDDFHLGIGSELLLFFPDLPSLQVRGYFGVDLMVRDWSESTKWEMGLNFKLLF